MTGFDVFAEPEPFPGQDPWIVQHEGAMLLIQAAENDRRIVLRRFTDLEHMRHCRETVIWEPPEDSDHGEQIWAPELHEIAGRWYVYYSASDGYGRNHRTYVLEADGPFGPYREAGRICDPRHDSWAIDLTVLRHEGHLYAVWSGRDGDEKFPQNLYIAAMADPCTMAGERRLISAPEHDWEMSVAAVNEAPAILRNSRQQKLFITYSADASWTQAYKMALLEWQGGDPTDPASWRKRPRPLLLHGGHACFLETDRGNYVVYHRKLTADPGWADRVIHWAPYRWDAEGYPVILYGHSQNSAKASTGFVAGGG
jgi:GH43 family beta-xylosidase